MVAGLLLQILQTMMLQVMATNRLAEHIRKQVLAGTESILSFRQVTAAIVFKYSLMAFFVMQPERLR